MSSAITLNGNNPEKWEKLLTALDEKLQFSLLGYIARVKSYHFEGEVLYLEPATHQDGVHLKKAAVLQQLGLLAQDAIDVCKVEILPCKSEA